MIIVILKTQRPDIQCLGYPGVSYSNLHGVLQRKHENGECFTTPRFPRHQRRSRF